MQVFPEKYANFDFAQVLLTSIPYDGTSTWGKGADEGFKAFMNASENMELFDIETMSEPYKKGVYLEKPLKVKNEVQKKWWSWFINMLCNN